MLICSSWNDNLHKLPSVLFCFVLQVIAVEFTANTHILHRPFQFFFNSYQSFFFFLVLRLRNYVIFICTILTLIRVCLSTIFFHWWILWTISVVAAVVIYVLLLVQFNWFMEENSVDSIHWISSNVITTNNVTKDSHWPISKQIYDNWISRQYSRSNESNVRTF